MHGDGKDREALHCRCEQLCVGESHFYRRDLPPAVKAKKVFVESAANVGSIYAATGVPDFDGLFFSGSNSVRDCFRIFDGSGRYRN